MIYTHAGPEIAVASTKAFTVQMAVMFLLALELGLKNGMIQPDECRSLTDQLLDCRNTMEQALELTKTVPDIVEKAIDCPACSISDGDWITHWLWKAASSSRS